MVKKGIQNENKGAKIFIAALIVIADIIVLYPLINVVSVSFASYSNYVSNPMMLFPTEFSLGAYQKILQYTPIWSGYTTTLFVTIVGTALGTFLTILTAYSLSKDWLRGRAFFMNFILFTMFFSGGIIPSFLLMRNINLLDSLWALILPSCLSAYNIILMRNFFTSLPKSLFEAAEIDGASEPYILFKIVIPLSKAIIATILLFLAVGYWNNYFSAILYISSQSKWPLQLVLRELIMSATVVAQQTGGDLAEESMYEVPLIMIRYAAIVVATVPILCAYPFVQKYFSKGVMLGAVKG